MAPICRDCAHYRATRFGQYVTDDCARLARVRPVRGDETRLMSCNDQRSDGWLARLFFRDRCGPQGQYWRERLPPRPADAPPPPRPKR